MSPPTSLCFVKELIEKVEADGTVSGTRARQEALLKARRLSNPTLG